MTIRPCVHNQYRGFTLIETSIYLALLSILFTGILLSAFSFFTSAEHLSQKIVKENEIAFVTQKILSLLNAADSVGIPRAGESSSTLMFSTYAGDVFVFKNASGTVTLQQGTTSPKALTTDRVVFDNFYATHTAPLANLPRYLEYSFTVDGQSFGPIRTYFSF